MTIQPAEYTDRGGVATNRAGFIGQATAVEQARAAAEVQAAVVVAQNVPRILDDAVRQMRETCSQKALADRAFYRYPRGGKRVTGPSVHLARELARCFGNFQHGVHELRRDDQSGESEVIAFAWDVQNNSRCSRTIIVPHERDLDSGGRRKLTALRDIQEMIANQGSRVEREMILDLLPAWYVEEAKDICNRVVAGEDGDKPLTQRIADTIGSYADNFGVTKQQLEDKLGRKSGSWVAQDLATLRVIWKSLKNGEVAREDEFPAERVTAADITGPPAEAPPVAMTDAQKRRMFALFAEAGITDRADDAEAKARQLDFICDVTGERRESRGDLTRDEAAQVIDALERQVQP
jgi:hypothetical protein